MARWSQPAWQQEHSEPCLFPYYSRILPLWPEYTAEFQLWLKRRCIIVIVSKPPLRAQLVRNSLRREPVITGLWNKSFSLICCLISNNYFVIDYLWKKSDVFISPSLHVLPVASSLSSPLSSCQNFHLSPDTFFSTIMHWNARRIAVCKKLCSIPVYLGSQCSTQGAL